MSPALQTAVDAASLLVGLVLLGAGMPKALYSITFARQIDGYGLVPKFATRFLARMVSSAELLAAAMLIAGLPFSSPLRRMGAGLAAFLFVLFLAALASAYARGRKIACACFGGNGELEVVGVHSLVRTGLLLVLAGMAILPAHGAQPLEVIGFAAVLAALVAVASETARLLGPLRRATGLVLEQLNAGETDAEQVKVAR